MLYLLEICVNYIIGKIKYNAKIPALLGAATLAYYAGTMKANSSFDTLAYQNYYNQVNSHLMIGNGNAGQFEIGFKYLNLLGGYFGLNYETFRLITFFIFFTILLFALFNFKINMSKFIAVYSIIPFFSDATQVRYFFMISLVLFAYSIVNRQKKFSYLGAIILIFIAASIHSTGYIYLIGLAFLRFEVKSLKKVLFYIIPVILVTFLLIKLVNPVVITDVVYKIILQSGRENFDTLAITSGISTTQFVQYFVIALLMSYAVYFKLGEVVFSNKVLNIMVLFLVQLITFPTIAFSGSSFSRLIRAGFISLLLLNSMKKKNQIPRTIKFELGDILFVLVFILGLFVFDGGIIGHSQFSQFIPYILHFR